MPRSRVTQLSNGYTRYQFESGDLSTVLVKDQRYAILPVLTLQRIPIDTKYVIYDLERGELEENGMRFETVANAKSWLELKLK